MKKWILLFTVMFCCSWVVFDAPPITEATVNDKKKQCEKQIDAMFYDYNILLNGKKKGEDKNKEPGQTQYETIEKIQKDYFLDNVIIEGHTDISKLHREKYDSKAYFREIQEAYAKLEATITTDIKSISDVYFDNEKNYYFMVVNVEKTVVANPGTIIDNDDLGKKSIDIYYAFTLEDRKPKIFSIQTHKENALDGFSPVKVTKDQ